MFSAPFIFCHRYCFVIGFPAQSYFIARSNKRVGFSYWISIWIRIGLRGHLITIEYNCMQMFSKTPSYQLYLRSVPASFARTKGTVDNSLLSFGFNSYVQFILIANDTVELPCSRSIQLCRRLM